MFGMGMTELLVILVLALLVLGPKKLPSLASSLGKAIRSFRRATQDLSSQLEIEDEVNRPFQELQAALRDEPAPARMVPPPKVTPAPAPAPESKSPEAQSSASPAPPAPDKPKA